MTQPGVADEIIRQCRLLVSEGRRPLEARLGLDQYHEVKCDARVGVVPGEDRELVRLHSIRIVLWPGEMCRVIPTDWGGYGQGQTRPRRRLQR